MSHVIEYPEAYQAFPQDIPRNWKREDLDLAIEGTSQMELQQSKDEFYGRWVSGEIDGGRKQRRGFHPDGLDEWEVYGGI
jgi:hypothetical protein